MMTLTETQARQKGFWIDKGGWIAKGGYVGTCDDRADRWYINRIGNPINHQGKGFATRAAALQHLAESLCSGDILPKASHANFQDDIHKQGG
jgi:hypothetical protein